MIYLTGDTHGQSNIAKLMTKNFFHKSLNKNDYVIILGDFGFIWNNVSDKTEKYWMDWFCNKPWTTLFIDGNHSNFTRLNAYPITTWNGGKIHQITDSVIHLMRGQVFTLQGKKFFTFGGASSIDKHIRIEGISWWKEELPNYQEQEEGFYNLQTHNFKVDYVLTHTCPQSITYELLYYNVIHDIYPDPTENLLERFKKILTYSKWYFGHYHVDLPINDKFMCLYNNILPLR